MRMRASLIAAVLFALSATAVWAGPVAYGVAYDELYRVDLGTREATYVGRAGNYGGLPLAALSGLTYGPGNTLYAVAGNQKALVRIERTDGSTDFVGRFDLGGQGQGQFNALDLSMTYGCDGSFWLTSAISKDLWRVNAQTATLTLVGNTGRQLTGLSMRNGQLYGVGVEADSGLFRIDTTTAAATRIGSYTATVPWIDPDFGTDGTLWAVLSYNPPFNREWNDLARFDASTGAMTILGPITGPDSLRYFSMKGLAVAPPVCTPEVPSGTEPAQLPTLSNWSLLLLGLLLLVPGMRRLARRH